jgi:hypothetical protein
MRTCVGVAPASWPAVLAALTPGSGYAGQRPAREQVWSPALFQNNSGILWKAMRVGAALKAVSMVAGATVLKPYLLLI